MPPNNSEAERLRNIRKYATFGVIGTIVLILFAWYFSNGWVRISTDAKDATITVYQSTGKIKEIKGSSLFSSLKPGDYTITVVTDKGASSKFVKLGYGTIHISSIAVHNESPVEPVIARNAIDISASNNHVSFIEPEMSRGFSSISPDAYEHTARESTIQQIDWLSPDFGAAILTSATPPIDGQTDDPTVGVVDKGVVTDIPTPFSLRDLPLSVRVTENRGVAVSAGNVAYVKSSLEAGFKQVIKTEKPVSILSAKKNLILFEQKEEKDEVLHGTLISINEDGSRLGSLDVTHAVDPSNIPNADISPDNTLTVVTIAGTAFVYDMSLQKQHELPSPSTITSARWLNNTTVIYLSNHRVWKYDLDTKTASSLGKDSDDSQLYFASIDREGGYVYYATVSTAAPSRIARVPLDSNETSTHTELTEKLSILFPFYASMALCRAEYILLAEPTILITKETEETPEQTEINLQFCRETVEEFLDKQQVDKSSLKFIVGYLDQHWLDDPFLDAL